jgi:hypothetical protein
MITTKPRTPKPSRRLRIAARSIGALPARREPAVGRPPPPRLPPPLREPPPPLREPPPVGRVRPLRLSPEVGRLRAGVWGAVRGSSSSSKNDSFSRS